MFSGSDSIVVGRSGNAVVFYYLTNAVSCHEWFLGSEILKSQISDEVDQ